MSTLIMILNRQFFQLLLKDYLLHFILYFALFVICFAVTELLRYVVATQISTIPQQLSDYMGLFNQFLGKAPEDTSLRAIILGGGTSQLSEIMDIRKVMPHNEQRRLMDVLIFLTVIQILIPAGISYFLGRRIYGKKSQYGNSIWGQGFMCAVLAGACMGIAWSIVHFFLSMFAKQYGLAFLDLFSFLWGMWEYMFLLCIPVLGTIMVLTIMDSARIAQNATPAQTSDTKFHAPQVSSAQPGENPATTEVVGNAEEKINIDKPDEK